MTHVFNQEHCGFSRELIESIAEEFNNQDNTINSLVKDLGGTINYIDDTRYPINYSLTVNSNKDWSINTSFYLGLERSRASIMHEVGHFILHSKSGEIPGVFPRFTTVPDRMEWEANWFSSAYLMPEARITEDFKNLDEKYKKLEDILSQLTGYYNLNAKFIELRLKRLGLVK